jgi:general secretion pathway protein K
MTRPSSKPNDAGAQSERGFILVAVLWILSALAVLSAVYSIYVSDAAVAAHVTDDGVNAEAAVRAGVELAAYEVTAASESPAPAQSAAAQGSSAPAQPAAAPPQLAASADSSRPAQGGFAFRLGRSRIKVSFIAEGARIDLNAAPKPVLVGLFQAIGAKSDDAATFADRIVGWRKKADGEGQDAEAAIYKSGGYSYGPREAPFQDTLELTLVAGIPKYIVERVLPLVTVYSGQAQVDVRVASPEVLAALPGMTPDMLKQVLAQRAQEKPDPQSLIKLLGTASTNASVTSSKATRVLVNVRLGNGRDVFAEVVIVTLQNDDEPYRVLSWRDDIDGPL